jgi:hypothetical protein
MKVEDKRRVEALLGRSKPFTTVEFRGITVYVIPGL